LGRHRRNSRTDGRRSRNLAERWVLHTQRRVGRRKSRRGSRRGGRAGSEGGERRPRSAVGSRRRRRVARIDGSSADPAGEAPLSRLPSLTFSIVNGGGWWL